MSNRTAILIVFLSVVITGTAFLLKSKKIGFHHEQVDNWVWEDEWENKTSPIKEHDETDAKPEIKTQVIATTYKEALQKSGELGMPALIVFSADWCGYCKKMKSETMVDKDVVAVMKNYILVYVDSDKDREGIRKFGVQGLPTCVITNYKEDNLKTVTGYQSAGPFAKWLDDPSLYSQPKSEGSDKSPDVESKKPEVQPKKQKIRM